MAQVVHKGGPSVVGTGPSCKICGHPAHCGGPAYMTFKDYTVDGATEREVRICNSCSCSKCTKEKTK